MCGRAKMLTQNQINGIHLERVASWFLKQKLKLGDKVDHNVFDDSYPMDNHNIVDIVVKEKALVECTNPKSSTWMNDDIMQKKLDYFQRADPHHFLIWFLIVSFANFSDAIFRQIKCLRIVLIETGIHAGKNNFWDTVKKLFHTRLYRLLTKTVKGQIALAQQVANQVIHLTQSTLTTVSIPSIAMTTKNNYIRQHTTSIEEDYKQYTNDMLDNNIWSVNHPKHEQMMDAYINRNRYRW